MSKLFNDLLDEIERGLKGENGVIPLQLGRLSEYLEISKGTMYTIGAETSGGKTSFALDQFMIYPLRWYMENKDKMNVKLNVIYFCMERSQVMNTAKLISKLAFERDGQHISAKKIMGRHKDKLTESQVNYIKRWQEYVDEMISNLKIYEGVQTAESITKILEEYAANNGREIIVKDDDGEDITVYLPRHPNHITLILVDHIGLISKTKESIDAFSKIMRISKDYWKFSPVVIQQFNREIADSKRGGAKNRPKLSDFEGAASTQQDSEVVVALYNPYTHLTKEEIRSENPVEDIVGYDLMKLRNEYGIPMYRSIHLLKNTYGGAGLYTGLAFQPMTGTFKEIPRPDEITDWDYDQITSESIFTDFKTQLL